MLAYMFSIIEGSLCGTYGWCKGWPECGDLNLSCDDIQDAFVENMVRRGICWCSDT